MDMGIITVNSDRIVYLNNRESIPLKHTRDLLCFCNNCGTTFLSTRADTHMTYYKLSISQTDN